MQNLEIEKIDDKEALREAITCLLKYIEVHGSNNLAFATLNYLANETIQRIDQNQNDCQFTNESIYKAIVGNKKVDFSSWFSKHWLKLSEISHIGLEDFARERGYNHFAWIDKKSGGGSGNNSLYFIVCHPVENNIENLFVNLKPDVRYIEITNFTSSLWAKWLFNKNFSADGWRKKVYIFYYPIFFLLFAILLIYIFWIVLNSKTASFSAQDMTQIIFALGLAFYAKFKFYELIQLLEDRITMAPLKLLSSTEQAVCLELVTTPDKKNKILRLVKYASQCPICQAEILLDKGEPDFQRRIVGRCKESPREHVYSFDRITLTGNKLR